MKIKEMQEWVKTQKTEDLLTISMFLHRIEILDGDIEDSCDVDISWIILTLEIESRKPNTGD